MEIARNGETAQTVEQFMMPIANFKKPELLTGAAGGEGSDRVIVFARTKNRTEDCAEALCDAGYRAESIHSDKSQGQRKRALDNFRRGRTSILVATDVLARGIDVPDVDHVTTSTCPTCPRTTCTASAVQHVPTMTVALTFINEKEQSNFKSIENFLEKEIYKIPIPEGWERLQNTNRVRSTKTGTGISLKEKISGEKETTEGRKATTLRPDRNKSVFPCLDRICISYWGKPDFYLNRM